MFYKYQDNQLMSGPYVQLPDGLLHVDFLEQYTFPVQGWYYFATEEEAKTFFGVIE